MLPSLSFGSPFCKWTSQGCPRGGFDNVSGSFLVPGPELMLRVDLVKAGELPEAGVEGHDPCGRGLVIIYPPGTLGLDSCLYHL